MKREFFGQDLDGDFTFVANGNKQVSLSRPSSRSIEAGLLLHFCSINKGCKAGF
jgi:hypothetical protein